MKIENQNIKVLGSYWNIFQVFTAGVILAMGLLSLASIIINGHPFEL